MSITLTESAASEIKRVMEEQKDRDDLKYVRVGIIGGGCGGMQYAFNFTGEYDTKKDVVVEQHGVDVVVDKKSDLFLDGTTIDFYSGLDRRGFQFNNPNAVKTCGCGSSFSC